MNDICIAVLATLGLGNKPCSEIAADLHLASPKVSGALVKLLSNGLVSVSGKVRIGGKDVSVYALTGHQPVAGTAPSAQTEKLSEDAITMMMNSNLYQLWGGFAPFEIPSAKVIGVRRYAES